MDILYRKKADWSTFNDGMTIPLEFHQRFFEHDGREMARGESRVVQLVFDGKTYEASLRNVNRAVRSNTLQLRYDSNRDLQAHIRESLAEAYRYVASHKVPGGGERRPRVRIPEELSGYLDVLATGDPYKYVITCVTPKQRQGVLDVLSPLPEEQVEQLMERASEQSFSQWVTGLGGRVTTEVRQGIVRVRHLSRLVIHALKTRYAGRCQVCRFSAVTDYGADISQAHHLDPVSRTLDNNASNIMIVCPNHHQLFHVARGRLIRAAGEVAYANGHRERVSLDLHLDLGRR